MADSPVSFTCYNGLRPKPSVANYLHAGKPIHSPYPETNKLKKKYNKKKKNNNNRIRIYKIASVQLRGNTLPSRSAPEVFIMFFIIRRGALATTTSVFFSAAASTSSCVLTKHPAYVGVDDQLQLQVVLDQAFLEATIANDNVVALHNDSSTTTWVKEEHQHHKQCQRNCPSLRVFNFHFSVPLPHCGVSYYIRA